MAISKAEKAAYNDEIKDIKKSVEGARKKINEVIAKQRKLPRIREYYDLELVMYQIEIMEKFMKMSDTSMEMLGIKNESFLNNARKEFYKVLQTMENIVGTDIDRSLKSNEEYLVKINRLNPAQILDLIQKIHTVLMNLKHRLGEGSKWKWSFVELQARVAVITKNITSFADVARYRDPRTEFFYERRDLKDLALDNLTEAAKQYRTKYEMAGKSRDDLKKSIDFLSAKRKILAIMGDAEEATKLKNTIDAARQVLDAEDSSSVNK